MAAAIGAAVVAVGGWGTVATVALTVASMAYSYSVAKKAKNASSGDPAERKQILRSSSAPKNYIYGQVRSSGVLVFAQEEEGDQTDNEWVHLALTHAGHQIEWAGDVYLNDETSANFPDHCEIANYPAGRTTADPYMVSKCKDWSDTMIGKDFAWMRISLKFSQEKFPSGLPNINSLKKGFKVPNLETGAVEWSDNPALCILHFLRLKGWEDEYLILDTFKEAARICAEEVANDDGTSSKRYAIGCEFDDSDTPASVLDKMLSTCGGEWVRVGGRLGLRVAAYYGPAFIDINEDDIIDGIEIQPEVERSDSFNIVRGTFVSPEQNYTEIDYPEVRIAEWVADDQEEIIMDMDLNYVQNPWQAQRLADIALKRARLGMTLKLPCNMRAFQATPGTMINLSLSTIGFNKEEFMVVDWDFSIDGGVNLIVRRDLPEFYDDAVGRPIATPPIIDLPVGGVPAPTNPLYTAKPVGDIVQGVVSWTNTAFQLSHTNVIVKDSNGFIIQSAQIPFPGNDMELNGKLAGSYEIELQSFGVNGRASTITQMDIVISAPTTPDTVASKASNWSIHLIPSYVLGTTPFGTLFEFYVSTTNDPTPPDRKPDEVASSWNQGGLTPDTYYYYWIRAVNSYGKSGWVQKTARTTRETGLVETLVEKLVGIEIYASYIASDQTSDPAFLLDGRPDHGNGLIKGGKLVGSSMTSDNYVAGSAGFKFDRTSAEINSNVNIKAANIQGELTAATVRANKIIGNLTSSKSITSSVRITASTGQGSWQTLASYSVSSSVVGLPRTLYFLGAYCSSNPGGISPSSGEFRVLVNGSVVASGQITLGSPFNIGSHGKYIGTSAASLVVQVRRMGNADGDFVIDFPSQTCVCISSVTGGEFN
ncbi:tail fiber protein [Vibrio phage K394]